MRTRLRMMAPLTKREVVRLATIVVLVLVFMEVVDRVGVTFSGCLGGGCDMQEREPRTFESRPWQDDDRTVEA